jgi:hypothetical protein
MDEGDPDDIKPVQHVSQYPKRAVIVIHGISGYTLDRRETGAGEV